MKTKVKEKKIIGILSDWVFNNLFNLKNVERFFICSL